MSNYFLTNFQKMLKNKAFTAEDVKAMMESADFFFKVLKVKVESKDPEMEKQVVEEVKAFKELLEKQLAAK